MTKLAIATPIYGRPETASVAFGYHTAVRSLERGGAVVLGGDLLAAEDLVKARMRLAHGAMARDCDWVLWWDSDVVPKDPSIVARMLACAVRNDWEVIAAPYPRKSIPTAFPYRPSREMLGIASREADGRIRVPLDVYDDCVEIDAIGFGFVLMRTSVLRRMVEHYRDELWCVDTVNGQHIEMVSLFSLLWTDPIQLPGGQRFREQLNEDYSWCVRWRRMGGRIFMYVGEGSPLAHVGSHVFQGTPAELGMVR